MSRLFPRPRDQTFGFIIVDAANGDRPLAVHQCGLLLPAKEPSFFRIVSRFFENGSVASARQRDYNRCRKQAIKVIERHRRTLSAFQSVLQTRASAHTKTASSIKPKILPIKTNPL